MRKYKKMSWMVVVSLILMVSVSTGAEELAAETGESAECEQRSWTVAIISDLNSSYGSTEYNQHVRAAVEWITDELQPDLVLTAGDMVAGQRAGLNYPAMWAAFHDEVTDKLAAAGIPFAVTAGNHDASGSSTFWEERIEYAQQWKVRRPQLSFVDDAFYPFHYAFTMGPALFISLDGTLVGDLDDSQLNWVEDVLERNSHLEVSFVFSHIPQYAVAEGRERELFDDRRLAELFSKHGVDMMISGHHHVYYPARREGTVYLHTSALGSGPRALLGESSPRPRNVAVVQYTEEGVDEIKAFESPDFVDVVDHDGLPESLGEGELKIWREDLEQPDDVADEDLPES